MESEETGKSEIFAKNMIAIRRHLNLSLEKFANLVHLSSRSISRYEEGYLPFDKNLLHLGTVLADMLDIPELDTGAGVPLIKKDIQKMLPASPPIKKLRTEGIILPQHTSTNMISKVGVEEKSHLEEDLTDLERNLPYIIREIVSGSPHKATSKDTLLSALNLLKATGMDPKLNTTIINLLNTMKEI